MKLAKEFLLSNKDLIEHTEKLSQFQLAKLFRDNFVDIKKNFDAMNNTSPYWVMNQHGGQNGNRIQEVAENSIRNKLISGLPKYFDNISFDNIVPYGSDSRFLVWDTKTDMGNLGAAYIQEDYKAIGPRDVSSAAGGYDISIEPAQISGDGIITDNVMSHSVFELGKQKQKFGPCLPPFIIHEGRRFITVTTFVKVFYNVEKDNYFLSGIELACVPNGLILWDREDHPNLFLVGRDGKKNPRRIRVDLRAIRKIPSWRWRWLKIGLSSLGANIDYADGSDRKRIN